MKIVTGVISVLLVVSLDMKPFVALQSDCSIHMDWPCHLAQSTYYLTPKRFRKWLFPQWLFPQSTILFSLTHKCEQTLSLHPVLCMLKTPCKHCECPMISCRHLTAWYLHLTPLLLPLHRHFFVQGYLLRRPLLGSGLSTPGTFSSSGISS